MEANYNSVDLSGDVVNFVVVYRTGGDYDKADYVTPMARMVHKHMTIPHRLVVMTDVAEDVALRLSKIDGDHIAVPLVDNFEGWWSIVEIFRLRGPVVFTGLDTVITGEIDTLGHMALEAPDNKVYMLWAFADRLGLHEQEYRRWASGIMVWRTNLGFVYDSFEPSTDIPNFKMEQRYSAHSLLSSGVAVEAVQDGYDGIISYKHQIASNGNGNGRLPEGAKFVLFHGEPRPHEVAHLGWMKEYWK